MSLAHLRLFLLAIMAGALTAADEQLPNLIPLPAQVELRPGSFRLEATTAISAPDALRSTAELCASQLRTPSDFPLPVRMGGTIVCELDGALLGKLTEEGYVLEVSPQRVLIRAAHRRGVFYGFQTFRQLLPDQAFATAQVIGDHQPWTARCVRIEDRPRFGWRAMMLDSARTFQDATYIRRYIDWLAVHKINILHWHLTDDEGWRIEIKALPELTRAGAWHGPKLPLTVPGFRSKWFPADDRHGGFYTQEELRGIVAYAAERGIDILPEIDVPGHSRAVAVAYPEILCQGKTESLSAQGHKANVWCASRPENEAMLASIFTEVAGIFPFTYIHIGGDEVNHDHWRNCPRCNALAQQEGLRDGGQLQPLVTRRMETLCAKLGRKLVGWNEIMGKGISTTTCIMSWTGVEPGYAAAAKGHPVVMAPGPFCYFDMAQAAGERGHWWAGTVTLDRCYSFDPLMNPSLTAAQLGNIMGVEACLWTEFCLPHPATQQRMGLSDADLFRGGIDERPAPPGFIDYQTHPRLAALAEVAWTPQDLRSYPDFAKRLGRGHLARLGRLGISYRVPTPTAQHAEGLVTILPPWDGAEVRYTTDGSTPTSASTRYTAPFPCSDLGGLRMITVTTDGRTSWTVSGAERAPVAAWMAGTFTQQSQRSAFALHDAIDRPGNWSVEVRHRTGSSRLHVTGVRLLSDGTVLAEDIHECLLSATSVDGGGANGYRLPVKSLPRGGRLTLEITASTLGGSDCAGFARLACSPWHEPAVTVASDLPVYAEHAVAHAGDWNRTSVFWSNRGAKKGETVTWTFSEPVPPSDVIIPTGKPGNSAQDNLDSGTLLVSFDGTTFEALTAFNYGLAKASIDRPFKALRLRADADMNGKWLMVQDPQILLRGLTPACTATSTMPNHAEYVAARAADWKRDTWFWSNRAPKQDDTFVWTFAAPIACSTVEVVTGEPGKSERDDLDAGVLEASYDGSTWTTLGAFTNGRSTGTPTAPLKALRLRVTADQPRSWLMIQDPHLR